MADEHSAPKYPRARHKLQEKLKDIDRKLDHIILRLRDTDPRINIPRNERSTDEWPDACHKQKRRD